MLALNLGDDRISTLPRRRDIIENLKNLPGAITELAAGTQCLVR